MRIVFVDNLLLEQSGGRYDTVLQPHLGLISLIAVAEAAGHQASLYDPKLPVARGEVPLNPSLYRETALAVLQREPDVVGMTSLGCNFICTVKIARELKRLRPELPILLGGPHATVLDRAIVQHFDAFDVVVRHEAEPSLLPLLDALPDRRFAAVPGVTYRDGSEIRATPGEPLIADLDALPPAAYDHYPIAALGLTWLRVEAGRGCPFMCTFCSTASFFGRRYRLKSAVRLCQELDALHARYGITHFSLQHDLFTVNRSKVLEFCEAMCGRPYTWKCSARMDCVDPDLLERMSAAGCREIYFGIETGSHRMQKISQKRLDLSLFGPTLDAVDHLGMSATVSFITGYPQEDLADQDATLDLIGSCFYRDRPPHNVQLHMLTPEPGTRLLADFESSLVYDGYVSDFNFPTLESTDADLIREYPDVFMNHHYFESILPRQRHIFVTSLYYVLYRLGPLVIVQLLDRYQGRLSALIDAVATWAERRGCSGPASDSVLAAFVADTWGPRDYRTSLVRYLLAVARFATKEKPDPQAETRWAQAARRGVKPHVRYQLSPRALLLRDLHPCPDILDFLEKARRSLSAETVSRRAGPAARGRKWLREVAAASRNAGLDIANDGVTCRPADTKRVAPLTVSVPLELTRRRAHTLVVLERPGTDRLRNFVVDDRGADFLDFALEPRTGAALLKALGAGSAQRLAVRRFACELLRFGVLEKESGKDQRPQLVARGKAVEWGDRTVAGATTCYG